MDQKSALAEAAAGLAFSGRGATILIVEDSAIQAELLRRALEGAGYQVIAANNGAEGLAMAKADHPAAVVSDINMPVMDGYAMCHAIRGDPELRHTPVILLTMLSDPLDVIRGLNAGADAYLTKPYNIPTLVSRIESLLAYPPVPSPPVERRKVEVRLAGKTYLVDVHGPRMLNLLISTYENAVLQNRELAIAQQALEELNQHLEQKVLEKTAALRDSERRFRSLIEHASDLVAVIDAQGKIAYVSPSIRRLGGYEVDEILGTNYLDYAHPEDRPVSAAALAELVRNPGKPHVSEFRFRAKDGAWVTLESIARNALDDPAIDGIVINSRDVTERKKSEQALKLFRRLIDQSNDAIEVVDPVTLRYLDVNDRACLELGYSRDEMLSMSAFDIDRTLERSEVERVDEELRKSKFAIIETVHRRKDGSTFPVEVSISRVELDRTYHLISARDITERRRAQEDLEFKNRLLSTQQETSPDAILLVDGAMKILSHNRQFVELWGIPEEMVAARQDEPVLEFVVAQVADPQTFVARVRYLYEHKEERSHEEILLRDGRMIDRYSAPVIGASGKYYGRVWYFRDISERKRAEAKIVKLNRLYATLSGINTAIVHTASPVELFDRVCEVAVEHGHFSMAWIGTVDRANQIVTPVAHRGLVPEDMVIIQNSVGRVPEGQGPTATAICESRIIYTNDYAGRDHFTPWHAEALKRGIHGSATLPIKQGGEIVAVLKLYVRERDFFDADQLALLEEMRMDISFAMDRFDTEAKKAQAEAALRESEVRFRALIEHASDLTVVITQDGTISYVSPSAKRLAGYETDELRGKNMFAFIHPDDAQIASGELLKVNLVPGETHHAELRYRHKNGSWRIFEILARNLLAEPSVGGIVANMRDVTERKRAEDALAESEGKLKAIFDAAADGILLAETETKRFRAANASICRMLGYTHEEILNLSLSDIHPKEDLPRVAHQFEQQAKGEIGVAGELPMQRKNGSVFFADVNSTPVTLGGKACLLGVFRDITERKESEQALRDSEEDLRRSLEETIRAVAATVEMRDAYTAGHQRRVADLAVAIAKELKLPEEQIHALHLAGTVHDLGKIHIPAEILSKPGKLTDIEFSLIKGHPQAGYDILKDVEFPWPIAQMVLQHHERLDGSGYPQGMKGDAIILAARILAVADMVEAMSSHRPYRPGLGVDAALAQIRQEAGIKLDARVVDACERVLREQGFSFGKA